MRTRVEATIACLTIFSMLLWIAPAPALAFDGGARLEGLLLDTSGMPAKGLKVHLIDADGKAMALASASQEGLYSFRDLPAGEYSLGIENGSGQMAPVAAPPVLRHHTRRTAQRKEASTVFSYRSSPAPPPASGSTAGLTNVRRLNSACNRAPVVSCCVR